MLVFREENDGTVPGYQVIQLLAAIDSAGEQGDEDAGFN